MMLIGANMQRLIGTRMEIEIPNFFKARKMVNRIISLDDEGGNKITNKQGLRDVAQQYFVNILQKQNGDFSSVIDVINSSISNSDNEMFTTPFTKAKFRDIVVPALMAIIRDFINTFGIFAAMIFLRNVVLG